MGNWSLRVRFFVLAVAPLFVLAAILAGYFIWIISSNHEKNTVDNAIGLARQLAAIAEEGIYTEDPDLLKTIAVAALDEKDIISASFYTSQGTPLAATLTAPKPIDPANLELSPTVIHHDSYRFSVIAPVMFRRPAIGVYPFHDALSQLKSPILSAAIGWVAIEYSNATTLIKKYHGVYVTLAAVGGLLIFAAGLALLLGHLVALPILKLQRAVHAISSGNLNVRLPVRGASDTRRLARDFNNMANALYNHRGLLEARVQEATQELEQRKNEAEKANFAKSRFLAAASHDLRQPLHALALFVSDLKTVAADPVHQKHLIDKIESSVQLTSQLLDTLLDISKLDIADITPNPTCIALNDLFDRMQIAYSRSASEHGLQLRCITSHAGIYTDISLIERLLGNLISNAIRYTAPSGTILIAARRCHDPAFLRIEIRDNGIGISSDHQHAIFEEFFQVGNSARDSSQGLGLGLTIVKRIANILGLKTGLRSKPGRGSVFWVEVPRAASSQTDIDASLASDSHDNELLLFGLENELVCSIHKMAETWGYTTRVCDKIPANPEPFSAIITTLETFEQSDLGQLNTIVLTSSESSTFKADGHTHFLAVPIRPARLRALLSHFTI